LINAIERDDIDDIDDIDDDDDQGQVSVRNQ
jgi:hypothetical protein